MNTHEQSITMDLQAEIDRLRRENAELKKLASLKLSRSRIKELQTENERLQAVVQSSAMIAAKAEGLERELKHDAEMHLGTDKQIHSENLQLSGLLDVGDIHGERVRAVEAIKSKIAALKEQVANAMAFLASEKRCAKEKEKVCKDNGDTHGENFFAGQFSGYNQADIALQAINRHCLRDLLAPTIELLERACEQIKRGVWDGHNSGTWTMLNDELARLRKLIPERGGAEL